MATIFIGTGKAKKYLMSALSVSIPSDHRVSIDFNSSVFKQDNTEKTFTDLISLTRGSAAGYIDNSGNYAIAGVNAPRFHNDSSLGRGFLIEPAVTNLLANPSAPATQTITTNLSVTNWIAVQVWGAGSCAVVIKDSGGNTITSGVSTEAAPFMYKPLSASTGATVNVTPTNITHFQAYATALPRIKQTKTSGTVATEIVLFNKALLANLLGVRNELTIIIKKSEMKDYADASLSNGQSGTILQILQEADTKGLYVARKKGGVNKKGVLRVNLTAETSVDGVESVQQEVFALTISANKATMYQNGSIVELPITEALALTRLYLGGGITWSVTYSQLIKEVYIYDRKLTTTELSNIII